VTCACGKLDVKPYSIKQLYENFVANLGISASSTFPKQEVTLEIEMVVAAYKARQIMHL